MKNMKTWLSALLAVMMLLAMTGIAMADTVPTGSITVENLEPGETVTIYQVIEIESDGTAALKDPKWVSGIQTWITTNYSDYADAANLPADGSATVSKSTFYNALSGQLASLTAVKNEQVTAATCTVENLPIGSYMVLVMGGEKAHEAYLTSIRATKYDFDKAEWVVEDGVVVGTPDRSVFWNAQTPQVFRAGIYRRAHASALSDGFVGTDDSSLIERLGGKVLIVEGMRDNFKLTVPEDYVLLASAVRTMLLNSEHR